MQLELDFQALLMFIHMIILKNGIMIIVIINIHGTGIKELVQMVELILKDTIFMNKSVV